MTASTRNSTPSATKLSYDITSESDPAKTYLVIFDKVTGDWTCDCPDFRYRSGYDGYECKHVKVAQEQFLSDFAARMQRVAENAARETEERASVLIGTYPIYRAQALADVLRTGVADGMKIVLRGRTPKEGFVWGDRVSLPLSISQNAAVYIVKK